MVRPQVTGRAGRQVEDSFQRIKVIPQSQEEMLNYIKQLHNQSFHRVRPEKSPLLLLTSESACRFVGSFLSRHALLVTALCEARVTMKPSVNDWEKEP
jgi:hypothetical protein